MMLRRSGCRGGRNHAGDVGGSSLRRIRTESTVRSVEDVTDTAASKTLALVLAILGHVLVVVILALSAVVALGLVAFFLAPAVLKLV